MITAVACVAQQYVQDIPNCFRLSPLVQQKHVGTSNTTEFSFFFNQEKNPAGFYNSCRFVFKSRRILNFLQASSAAQEKNPGGFYNSCRKKIKIQQDSCRLFFVRDKGCSHYIKVKN